MKNYNSNIKLGTVVLNVRNLSKQLDFYTSALGMTIINRDEKSANLGTKDGNILLSLHEVTTEFTRSYGLYHVAYLVPNKQALADILKHFVTSKIPLVGAADHGYSDAIYLNDAEGNGIEVYYDKDMSLWDIRKDGRIIGITEQLDGDSLFAIAQDITPYVLPNGTTVGHVHLSVQNATTSTKFYQDILGFKDKMTVPSGSWIAYGDYHHHLAVNSWAGPNLMMRVEGTPGLAFFNIHVLNNDTYKTIVNNVVTHNITIKNQTENSISILDPNDIEIHISLINYNI